MPERTRKKRPADLNKLAASIAHAATEGEPEVSPADEGKNVEWYDDYYPKLRVSFTPYT